MKRAIAFLVLLFPLLTVAQNTFQPGYIIENGVTKQCLIKNVAWKNNPTAIECKTAENEPVQVKIIKEISEFSVGNDAYKYRRYTVNMDRSGVTIDKLSDDKQPEWKTETVFLKIMVEGKVTLYQFEDNNFVRYFFSTGDNAKAEQLVYKEYLVDGAVAKNNTFRQQLYNLMKTRDTDMADFEKLIYKKDPLVKLFLQYNGTDGQQVKDHTQKQNKGSINLKITPGVSFNSLVMSNGLSNSYFDFDGKTGFRIGAELEYIMPFNNNKWSLFLDPNYQSYDNDGNVKNQKTKAEYKYIEIPVGIRHYMFLNKNAKIFIDGAYVMALPLGDAYLQYGGSVFNVNNNSALSLGAGFSYKKYSVELRHNFKHSIIVNYAYWAGDYSSTSIILGYKLF